jgi:hypothetical protein
MQARRTVSGYRAACRAGSPMRTIEPGHNRESRRSRWRPHRPRRAHARVTSSGLSARKDGQLALSTSCPSESQAGSDNGGIDASGPVVTRENVTAPVFSSPLMLLPGNGSWAR